MTGVESERSADPRSGRPQTSVSAERRDALPPAPPGPAPVAILGAVAVGLALAAGAVTSGNLLYDTGAELARCVGRLDAEARRALTMKSTELTTAIARVRESAPLVLMTSIVFPFAEERIYRGLLQDVLVRKYGGAYGIFAASVLFGVAHIGAYQIALYQTALLGLGFGVAYAEGGLLAAFIVHATWNLVLLT
jgi:membrane protease YdiL (CAAX protease family)